MSGCEIDYRSPTPLDFADPEIGDMLRELKRDNYVPKIIELTLQQEAPDTTLTEIRVDFTVEFNGESSASTVFLITQGGSEDKAAGTGARAVTLYGIDENGDPATEAVTLHATAGTQIECSTSWKRLFAAKVTTAGSAGVNADTIQITNTGQTEVYMTIAAGENATINARVYIPANYNAFIADLTATALVAPHATDEVVYGRGAIIAPFYVNSTVTDLKVDQYWVNPDLGEQKINLPNEVIVGANTYYLTLFHATKTADANDTAIYNMKIIIYGTTNTLRGLAA